MLDITEMSPRAKLPELKVHYHLEGDIISMQETPPTKLRARRGGEERTRVHHAGFHI